MAARRLARCGGSAALPSASTRPSGTLGDREEVFTCLSSRQACITRGYRDHSFTSQFFGNNVPTRYRKLKCPVQNEPLGTDFAVMTKRAGVLNGQFTAGLFPLHRALAEPNEVIRLDLRRRVAATRLPDRETVDDGSQGLQLAAFSELMRHWATEYDWRNAEARLNACRSSQRR